MGTIVTLTVVAADESAGEEAIAKGFSEVARLEQLFSSYRSDSDLSRLNSQAGAGPVAVAAELAQLVFTARVLAEQTGGAFNPLMGPVIKAWGIPHNPSVPSPSELALLRPLIDLDGLSVDREQNTIALSRPGMAIGLGGIAKGYTADRVVELLERLAMSGGVVEISGDVRVFGRRPDGRPWRIAVRNPGASNPPHADQPLAVVQMNAGAISTSGDYERFFELDGVRYHHIFDPTTLKPARGVVSVTLMADSAVRADALATAVLVMGVQRGMAFVEGEDALEALMLPADGGLLASSGWPARILSGGDDSGPDDLTIVPRKDK